MFLVAQDYRYEREKFHLNGKRHRAPVGVQSKVRSFSSGEYHYTPI